MDAIQTAIYIPTPPAATAAGSGVSSPFPVAAAPVPDTTTLPVAHATNEDIAQAEQRRYAAVKQAAEDIANFFVLGDQKLNTIYKDSNTGQYVARYTSLRFPSRVTYVPETTLLARSSALASAALTLQA